MISYAYREHAYPVLEKQFRVHDIAMSITLFLPQLEIQPVKRKQRLHTYGRKSDGSLLLSVENALNGDQLFVLSRESRELVTYEATISWEQHMVYVTHVIDGVDISGRNCEIQNFLEVLQNIEGLNDLEVIEDKWERWWRQSIQDEDHFDFNALLDVDDDDDED